MEDLDRVQFRSASHPSDSVFVVRNQPMHEHVCTVPFSLRRHHRQGKLLIHNSYLIHLRTGRLCWLDLCQLDTS